MDIAAACIVGAPDPDPEGEDSTGDSKAPHFFRELATKILESGPQLYLQSYILFAVGSHGDPVKVASVAISILALGHGLLKVLSMRRVLYTHWGSWMTAFLVAFIGPSLEIRRISPCLCGGGASIRNGPRGSGRSGKLRLCHTQRQRRTCNVVELPNSWTRCVLVLRGLLGSFISTTPKTGLNNRACFAGPVGRNGNLRAFRVRICKDELRTRTGERGAGPLGPAGLQRVVLPHPPLLLRPRDG